MSDIKRDMNITQLKNLFFYTFGIVPLSYYNVVGDGVTDNRLQLQQAIDDAVAENIKYIFVEKRNILLFKFIKKYRTSNIYR